MSRSMSLLLTSIWQAHEYAKVWNTVSYASMEDHYSYQAEKYVGTLRSGDCSHFEKLRNRWERFDEEVNYVVPLARQQVTDLTIEEISVTIGLISHWILEHSGKRIHRDLKAS